MEELRGLVGEVERARRAAVARSFHQLEVLNEVARIAAQDLELRPMLQRIAATLRLRLGWDLVTLLSIDREHHSFVCEALATDLATDLHVGYVGDIGTGVVGEVALTGLPIVVDDVRAHGNYVELLRGARAELCLPIRRGDRIVALLNVESMRVGAFRDQLGFLSTIADQLSGIIANARAHAELRARADAVALLSEVSRRALDASDLGGMLRYLVEFIRAHFRSTVAAVLLVDEAERELEFAAFAGDAPLSTPIGTRWPAGTGIVGRAIRSGRPQLVMDVRRDPDYVAIRPDVVAEFAAPITASGRVLGVLNVESSDAELFTPGLVELLGTVAAQVAGAVRLAAAHARLTELFDRYVGPDLAKSLLADPTRFRSRGERRDATVLFCDVRGFTEVSQRLDSEELLALLSRFHAAMSAAVSAEGGSVNRILGDGLLAVFGVPEALADHAGAGVRAARRIHAAAAALSPTWQAVAGVPLRIVVSLHCGELIAGTLGDRSHSEFTVLGDVVNVAARLEAEAKRRDAPIVMTEAVREAARVEGAVPLGPVAIRGRTGTIEVFRLDP